MMAGEKAAQAKARAAKRASRRKKILIESIPEEEEDGDVESSFVEKENAPQNERKSPVKQRRSRRTRQNAISA